MALDWEAVAEVLVHPTARRVLVLCDSQTRSPNQMAKLMGDVALGSVSYHVRQLAEKGLLVLVHTEPRRGALEHYYRTAATVQKRSKRAAVQEVGQGA